MATLGHVAVGLAAARAYQPGKPPRWPVAALWSAAAVLPDADVITLPLGIRYDDQWGHRGFSHSLIFAVAIGLIAGLVARRFKQPPARSALFVGAVVASHGLLDTLSDGGLGCALLWPLDLTRYFAPWHPIPVAPIAFGMLSMYGVIVVLVEFVLFCPLLFVALRPPAARLSPVAMGAFTALWIASVWLLLSTDPVRESIVGVLLRDRTAFPAGFSESAFRTIRQGFSDEDVGRLLGPPHDQSWFYPSQLQPLQRAAGTGVSSLRQCQAVRFENGIVLKAYDADACRAAGIQPGTTLDDVYRLLGTPQERCWQYGWTPGFALRLRLVCFERGAVDQVIGRWAMSE